jgi:hypothetical protein
MGPVLHHRAAPLRLLSRTTGELSSPANLSHKQKRRPVRDARVYHIPDNLLAQADGKEE